jgi:branched-chain amino acid transport system substrate-binding protein
MRLKKFLVLGIGVLLVLALIPTFLTGCGSSGSKATVTIGLTAPLSGSGAGYGEDIRDGIDMAINKVNDAGGLTIGDTTYTFKLESADDQMVPDQATANANRFVLEDGINIIWDPTANTIAPLLQMNTKAGEEFMVMAYSSVPLYAQSPNKFMITLPPPFSVYLKPFITLAMGRGYKKCAMMQTQGAYGDLWASKFEPAWTGAGGTVVAKQPANYYTETDYSAYLTAALAQNPDVIFCGGPSDPTALLIKQARDKGFKGGFIVIDQAKLDVIAKTVPMDQLEGAIGVLPVALGANTWPYMTTFMDDFTAKYGRDVTWESAICYTGFHILTEAMKQAGSVSDLDAIRAAFAQGDVSVTSGDQWPVQFSGINDQTGALLMPGTATQVLNGAFTQEQQIEWWKS